MFYWRRTNRFAPLVKNNIKKESEPPNHHQMIYLCSNKKEKSTKMVILMLKRLDADSDRFIRFWLKTHSAIYPGDFGFLPFFQCRIDAPGRCGQEICQG